NRGLALSRETGNDYTEAVLLGCLGRVHLQQGRLDAAVNAYTQALSRFSTLGARQGQAAAHDALGEALHAKGIFGQARGHLLQALAIEREVGDRGTEVLTLRNLATLHRDAGELDRAAGYADSMHALAGELGDLRVQADALRTLAAVDHGRGSLERAVERYTAALEASRATGYPYPEIETMIGLAEAHESLGDKGRAKEEAAQAHGMASAIGYAMLADRAAAVLERLGSDPRE
ncbi:MAG TPA: hypothetical protein VF062_01205, partial [Candidatus Limnocylindrales bacterium]